MSEVQTFVHRQATPLAVAAAFLVTLLPFGLYVDEIFVTFLHEASHGLAAVLTGGSIVWLQIFADTSGLAQTQGGFGPLIVAGGYIGGCLWGGALIVAARQRGLEKAVCWTLAVFLGVLTLLYVRSLFGFVAGAGMSAFFGWVALRGAGWQLAFLLSFLGMRSVMQAFVDLKTLLFYASQHNAPRTDAKIMSDVYTAGLVPPMVFAIAISLVAVGALALFLYVAWRLDRPRPEELPG